MCTSPCLYCSNKLNNCTSCLKNLTVQTYLSGNTCVTSDLCPTGTYGNISSIIC